MDVSSNGILSSLVDLTEDTDKSEGDTGSIDLAHPEAIALNIASKSQAAVAKLWGMTKEELAQALQQVQEVSDDIPIPEPDPAWVPPRAEVLQQPMDSSLLSERPDGLNAYIRAMQDNTTQKLTQRLIEAYKAGSQEQINAEALGANFGNILFLTHTPVLVGVLQGTLAQRYFADADTRGVLDFLSHESAASRVRPGIYCNAIGHFETGDFLTLDEAYQVLDSMTAYVANSDQNLAKRIDNVHNPKTTKDRLRYNPNERAGVQIRTFISAFRARIDNMARGIDSSLPLSSSVLEFGFGLDMEKRFQSHGDHKNSNYIMNLFHACCEFLFGQKYVLHQFVVFLLQSSEQALIAEAFFHLIGHGYINHGAGFSHWPAGLGSGPSFRLSGGLWTEYARWCEVYTPICNNWSLFENAMTEHLDAKEQKRKHAQEHYNEIEAAIEKTSRLDIKPKVEAVVGFADGLGDLVEFLKRSKRE